MRRSPTASLATEVARAAQRRGAARLLVLDVDGTLAPIAPTPGEARVPKATLDALHGLVRLGWSIVVVSGRPAEEARRMVPVPGVRVFGSHGLERPRGRGRHVALAPRIRRRLALLAAAGARLASGIDGARVESKPAGVAFHDRTIPRPGLARWRRGVRELLAASDLAGLEVIRGHRVVEVRPEGVHKGTVLDAAGRLPAKGKPDPSLVALGDDRTDEDLFRAIGGRGLGVRVGRSRLATHATRRLPSPRAVLRFLEQVAEASRGER
jgi:trehalose 6-phosphate phosphatase